MLGTKIQRINMVKNQLRPAGILNPAVLEAMLTEPREHYLPEKFKHLAYIDNPCNRISSNSPVTLAPQPIGLLLQALNIKKTDKILEANTGSGYLTALLGTLSHNVVSLEPNLQHYQIIKKRFFDKRKYPNIRIFHANLNQGFDAEAPFDVICLNVPIKSVPNILFKQLKKNGRLFAFIQKQSIIHATLYKKDNSNAIKSLSLFENLTPDFSRPIANTFNL